MPCRFPSFFVLRFVHSPSFPPLKRLSSRFSSSPSLRSRLGCTVRLDRALFIWCVPVFSFVFLLGTFFFPFPKTVARSLHSKNVKSQMALPFRKFCPPSPLLLLRGFFSPVLPGQVGKLLWHLPFLEGPASTGQKMPGRALSPPGSVPTGLSFSDGLVIL